MTLKKVLKFIWSDNSLLSWVVNIILAFLIVKFLVYPGVGLIFDTSVPIVAVTSGSMDHDGNFEDWWDLRGGWYEKQGFTKDQFKSWIFSNGFNKGDIIFLKGSDNLKIGDVIVFIRQRNIPVIHRVVQRHFEEEKIFYTTRGDANTDFISDEKNIPEENILGKSIFRIPYLGWIKISASCFMENLKVKESSFTLCMGKNK